MADTGRSKSGMARLLRSLSIPPRPGPSTMRQARPRLAASGPPTKYTSSAVESAPPV